MAVDSNANCPRNKTKRGLKSTTIGVICYIKYYLLELVFICCFFRVFTLDLEDELLTLCLKVVLLCMENISRFCCGYLSVLQHVAKTPFLGC